MAAPRQLAMTIPADPAAIAIVTARVVEMLEEHGWPTQGILAVQLALAEALANAIRHGCQSDRTQHVECRVTCAEAGDVMIVVRDRGAGFDPSRLPDPLDTANLLKPNGRGIFLIKELMDEVRFNDGGREVQMRKKKPRLDDTTSLRILAISGSLRTNSSNRALVEAAAQLAPPAVSVSIYTELAELPPFNPDLDRDGAPAAVGRLRARLLDCDAVLISSPEYAHGVPGALKNALDWLVGSGELVGKPVAVLNASGRATHGWTSLTGTLSVMSARVIGAASITLLLPAGVMNAHAIVGDVALATALRRALAALVQSA